MIELDEVLQSGQLLERLEDKLFVLYLPNDKEKTGFDIRGLNDKSCKSILGIVNSMTKEEQMNRLKNNIISGKWKVIEFKDVLINERTTLENPLNFKVGSKFIDRKRNEFTLIAPTAQTFDLRCINPFNDAYCKSYFHDDGHEMEWSCIIKLLYDKCRSGQLQPLTLH